jgi:cell division protein FtsB
MLKKFTSHEKKLLSYAGLFFALFVLLWIIFAPQRGVFDMFRAQKQLKEIQTENRRLVEENKTLQEEIDRLQNDPSYLEEKARKEYGMLKENETLYIFKKGKK